MRPVQQVNITFSKLIVPFVLIWALGVMACEKSPALPKVEVDEAFAPYFADFEAEGLSRGRELSLAGIGAAFDSELERGLAGKCVAYESGAHLIFIRPSDWEKRTPLEREYLIFHELGHCALHRPHLDEADAQGNCQSMMQSGEGRCRNNYSPLTRERLLDELFKE